MKPHTHLPTRGLLALPRLSASDLRLRNRFARALDGRSIHGVRLQLAASRKATHRRWPLSFALAWQGHDFQLALDGAPFIPILEERLQPWRFKEVPHTLLFLAATNMLHEQSFESLHICDIRRNAFLADEGRDDADFFSVPITLLSGNTPLAEGVWYGPRDFPFEACTLDLLPQKTPLAPVKLHVALELCAGCAELEEDEMRNLHRGDVIFIEQSERLAQRSEAPENGLESYGN